MSLFAKRAAWLAVGILAPTALLLIFARAFPGVGFPLVQVGFAYGLVFGTGTLVVAGVAKALSYVR